MNDAASIRGMPIGWWIGTGATTMPLQHRGEKINKMFGSRHEPKLLDGRKIVWSGPSQGEPLQHFLTAITALPNQDDLLIGYWESGDAIVITAPLESPTVPNKSERDE